jgi:hypothetical protein
MSVAAATTPKTALQSRTTTKALPCHMCIRDGLLDKGSIDALWGLSHA